MSKPSFIHEQLLEYKTDSIYVHKLLSIEVIHTQNVLLLHFSWWNTFRFSVQRGGFVHHKEVELENNHMETTAVQIQRIHFHFMRHLPISPFAFQDIHIALLVWSQVFDFDWYDSIRGISNSKTSLHSYLIMWILDIFMVVWSLIAFLIFISIQSQKLISLLCE